MPFLIRLCRPPGRTPGYGLMRMIVVVRKWTAAISAIGGFIVVTPEYNYVRPAGWVGGQMRSLGLSGVDGTQSDAFGLAGFGGRAEVSSCAATAD